MNFSRMFGVDAEYMYYDLDFRPSVIQSQFLTHQSGQYAVDQPGRHRHRAPPLWQIGRIRNFRRRFLSTAAFRFPAGPSDPAQDPEPAWRWWDLSVDIFGNPIPGQTMSSNSKDAGGFNYGGGVTYRLNHLHNSKLYVEYRYHRAYHSDGQAIVVPITVGLRW